MRQTIFTQIEEGISGGKTAFILEFNTNDRQSLLEAGINPTALHLALATYFGKKGYHCGLYSSGIGVQELTPPGTSAQGANPFHRQGQQGANQSLNLLTPILRNKEIKAVLSYPVNIPKKGSTLYGILSIDSKAGVAPKLASPQGLAIADRHSNTISAIIQGTW